LSLLNHRIHFLISLVGVKAIVMAAHHRKSDYIAFINNLVPELKTSTIGNLKSARLPDLKHVIRIDNE